MTNYIKDILKKQDEILNELKELNKNFKEVQEVFFINFKSSIFKSNVRELLDKIVSKIDDIKGRMK